MGGGILNKNAFTLIELLAIIVILAIIAVITVPIILNIIENSKKGAITDSAYGYKDAINKTYVTELSKPNQEGLKLNGIYEVQSDGTLVPADGYSFGVTNYNTLPVSVSGEKPTSGTLTYSNNVLTSGTLVIGDYTATYSNGVFTAVKTGSSSNEQSSGENDQSGSGSGQSGNQTPTNPYLTTFDGNYTYYIYGIVPEDPTGYDFDYEDYQEPSNNNNECPSGYAYYAGDGEYNAGCYYINDGYCDNGNYNSDTEKCEDEGYHENAPFSNDWTYYLRNDGTTTEVCGVFSSGTVCLTSSYYNSNYSSEDGYESDFEDVNDTYYNITTSSGLSATGLKGYALTKAQEMLSKGALSCQVYSNRVECARLDSASCGVWSNSVDCNDGSNYSCYLGDDGSYGCG